MFKMLMWSQSLWILKTFRVVRSLWAPLLSNGCYITCMRFSLASFFTIIFTVQRIFSHRYEKHRHKHALDNTTVEEHTKWCWNINALLCKIICTPWICLSHYKHKLVVILVKIFSGIMWKCGISYVFNPKSILCYTFIHCNSNSNFMEIPALHMWHFYSFFFAK